MCDTPTFALCQNLENWRVASGLGKDGFYSQ